jgi:hypothetical protein
VLFRSTIGVALALLAAVLLGACGDDGSKQELSSGNAAELRAALDAVEQRVETHDCTGAVAQASSFRARVDELPRRVDGNLRRALSASADRLETLVAHQCRPEEAPAPVEEPPAGTTTEEEIPPEGEQDQKDKPEKDKKPKKEKPNPDQQPDTGGAGEEDPTLDEQGGGVPPQE